MTLLSLLVYSGSITMEPSKFHRERTANGTPSWRFQPVSTLTARDADYPPVQLLVRPERHRAQSCAIALRTYDHPLLSGPLRHSLDIHPGSQFRNFSLPRNTSAPCFSSSPPPLSAASRCALPWWTSAHVYASVYALENELAHFRDGIAGITGGGRVARHPA